MRNTRVNALAITDSGERYTIQSNYTDLSDVDFCLHTHAEIKVIHELQGESIHTVIVTQSPCRDCAKALVESGVKVVGFLKKSESELGLQVLLDKGVTLVDMTNFLEGVEL